MSNSCINSYEKLNPNEIIEAGDIIALDSESNKVSKAVVNRRHINRSVIGVCNKIENGLIYVKSNGMIDVNVTGLICIGDHLTVSEEPGKASAIRYVYEDEDIFNIRSLGKVIGLYNDYDKAKVLLDIE